MIPITVWEVIRSLFFFIAFTVLPGLVIVYLLHSSLRMAEVVALTFGWSLGVNVVFGYAVHVGGGPLETYIAVVLAWDVLGCTVVLWKLLRQDAENHFRNLRDWLFPALVLVIGIIWFGVILQNGPRIDYDWDHWFHIAHTREVIESHQIIPPNPYWPDVELSEAFGMWHSLLAAVARSASLSVITLWRIGNAYMAALGFLIVYSTAGAFFSDRTKRLLAAVVFLGSGVGAMQITRTFLYPWGSTTLLLWTSLTLVFRHLKYKDRGSALSALVIGLIPVFIHPQEYLFVCFGLLALGTTGLLMQLAHRDIPIDWRRVWLFLLVLIVIGLPLLLIKYPGTLARVTGNNDENRSVNAGGELYADGIARYLAVVFPYYYKSGLLFHSLAPYTVVTLLLSLLVARTMDRPRGWFLLTMVWAPTLAALLPGLSWLTQLVLNETYAWRLLNLVPTPLIWSYVMMMGVSGRIGEKDSSADVDNQPTWGRWIYLALSATLLFGTALGIVVIIKYDELTPGNSTDKPLRFRAMYETLDQIAEEPAVILSDPMTSYTIPGLTPHRVVLNERSHGGRDDLLVRFTDARRLLSDPIQSPEDAIDFLDRYDVDFILVNKFWIDRVFFPKIPFYSDYTLSFLGANTACFRQVYTDQGFDVFAYLHCSPEHLKNKGLAPHDAISMDDIGHRVDEDVSDQLKLLGYSLFRREESDSTNPELRVDLYWEAKEEILEPYAVWVELLCDYPGRGRALGGLLRKWYERQENQTLMVEDFGWLPIRLSGLEDQDLLVQPFSLEIPSNMTGESCDLKTYALTHYRASSEFKMLPALFIEREQTLPTIHLTEMELAALGKLNIDKDL
jgi:hypothetical protein